MIFFTLCQAIHRVASVLKIEQPPASIKNRQARSPHSETLRCPTIPSSRNTRMTIGTKRIPLRSEEIRSAFPAPPVSENGNISDFIGCVNLHDAPASNFYKYIRILYYGIYENANNFLRHLRQRPQHTLQLVFERHPQSKYNSAYFDEN